MEHSSSLEGVCVMNCTVLLSQDCNFVSVNGHACMAERAVGSVSRVCGKKRHKCAAHPV